jgi:ABC-2 type transport system ATP-binding protein
VRLHAEGLVKRFGSFTAVAGVDLTVAAGEIHGFLGPNGAGKSTTVKMLTGLLIPTAGTVVINGISLAADPVAVKRSIGVLPEDLALFDALTIWEHLMLAGPLYGLTAAETAERAGQLLRERHTEAGQASFGMRKKTAFAMALLHNPKTLFLDEPFEGIDPSSAENMRELLVNLAAKGAAVFITSHLLDVVEKLVGTYSILSGGKVVASGRTGERPLKEVYFAHIARPAGEDFTWLG